MVRNQTNGRLFGLPGRASLLCIFCLAAFIGQAQIHVLHVNGAQIYRSERDNSDTERMQLTSIFDGSRMIIALDYEQLSVSISKEDGVPEKYAITTITHPDQGLECVFMDEDSGIAYSFNIYYLHLGVEKPLLSISWSSQKDNKEEYVLLSEYVTLY